MGNIVEVALLDFREFPEDVLQDLRALFLQGLDLGAEIFELVDIIKGGPTHIL